MILITGAAGYIGSHFLSHFLEHSKEPVIALDDLSSGRRDFIPSQVPFHEVTLSDSAQVEKIFKDHPIRSIVHFAAFLSVEESVREPAKYYANNLVNTANLARVARMNGVREFIFSSTCAIYGNEGQGAVNESTEKKPITPYGWSKFLSEQALFGESELAHQASQEFKVASLRYFNVAGAHPNGKLGQAHAQLEPLVRRAAKAACGKIPSLEIFGTHYPTRDGTCIRDYIHVMDLASLHAEALSQLRSDSGNFAVNAGYGYGYTVREVIEQMKTVSGVNFSVNEAPERSGDIVEIYADTTEMKKRFPAWKPKYDSLREICESAYLWEKKLN